MNVAEFKKSLTEDAPNPNLSDPLKALWWDAKGNWDKAHQIAQKKEGNLNYDIVHAYLHRKEGDEWNAKYWYNRCHKNFPKVSLEEEWEELAAYFNNQLPI